MGASSRIFRIFAATFVAFVLAAPAAKAFCRATPCDPSGGGCMADRHGCSREGPDLFWSKGRTTLSVDQGGSMLRGIAGNQAVDAVSEALGAWTSVTCDDGKHPSLRVEVASVPAGVVADFVTDGGANENDVLFRDGPWPYEPNAVAKTSIGMDLDTGEILDADIQLDSARYELSLDGDSGTIDVVAVLTHELGHVLGLGHSDVPGATMQPETSGFGTAELRSLEADDVAGICAIYPSANPPSAGRAPTVDSGSGDGGGCTLTDHRPRSSAVGALALCSMLALFRARRAHRL